MTLSVGLATAISGLQTSALQARTAAYNIANVNSQNFQPQAVETSSVVANSRGAGIEARITSGGSADLATNLVNLNVASTTYAANATVVRTLGDISGETVDLLA